MYSREPRIRSTPHTPAHPRRRAERRPPPLAPSPPRPPRRRSPRRRRERPPGPRPAPAPARSARPSPQSPVRKQHLQLLQPQHTVAPTLVVGQRELGGSCRQSESSSARKGLLETTSAPAARAFVLRSRSEVTTVTSSS